MTQHSFALTARWVTPHRILNIHSFMSVFLGTFRQRSPWDILTPASWSHPVCPMRSWLIPGARLLARRWTGASR